MRESKTEIYEIIQKGIKEEKGQPIKWNDKIEDANLDSLGLVIFFTELSTIYPILDDLPEDADIFKEVLKARKLTVKELVNKCLYALRYPVDKSGVTLSGSTEIE